MKGAISSCGKCGLFLLLGATILFVAFPVPVTASAVAAVVSTRQPPVAENQINQIAELPLTTLVSTVAAPVPSPSPTVGQTKQNPVAALVGYMKNCIVKTADGVAQLWTNHGACNEIRAKMKAHREALAETPLYKNMDPKESRKVLSKIEGGISYENYIFLQKGKEDRGKLMNMVFLMFGAPKFLPYAILFNPEMLPSPFVSPGSESVLEKKSRERSAAVINCLLNLESQAREVSALSKINIFSGKKQEERMIALRSFNERVAQIMDSNSFQAGGGQKLVLAKLDELIYRPVDETEKDGGAFSRSDLRLCQLAPSVVKGLANALGNAGYLAAVTPNFMNRGKLVGHAQKVADADYFLANADFDLDSIPWELLQEACADRMKGPAGCSPEELRGFLKEWLELTVHAPAARPDHHFNGNLARTALFGYNSLQSVRDARSGSAILPRLLFGGGRAVDAVTTKPAKKQEPAMLERSKSVEVNTEQEQKKKSWSKKLLRR